MHVLWLMVDPACGCDGVTHASGLENFVTLNEELEVAVNATFIKVKVISQRLIIDFNLVAIG